MLNKLSSSSNPIDAAKVQFSHDQEMIEDLKIVLDDLAASMANKVSNDRAKSDYKIEDKLKVYK